MGLKVEDEFYAHKEIGLQPCAEGLKSHLILNP